MSRVLLRLSVFFALLVIVAVADAYAADRAKLIIGGDRNCPPYEFMENGMPTGFDVELIQAVAAVMGFEAEIRLGSWSKARRDLEKGKADLLAGMFFSDERNTLFDFSVPHTMVSSGIFVRKDSGIRSFADIQGKEVIVQEGDIIHELLKRDGIRARIVAVTDSAECLKLLSSGKHDCAIMPSKLQGIYFIKKFNLNNIKAINTDLPQFKYCFAVRKGNRELLYKIDEGLNILKVNGTYQEIYGKWFGVYEKRYLRRIILVYLAPGLALVAVLFAASLAWSRFLQRQVRLRTAELLRSDEELRKAYAELEQRVEERTVELSSANERLTVSESEKSLILNSTKDLVTYQDLEMRILWANQRAASLANVSLEEFSGRHCWELFYRGSGPCPDCPVVAAGKTGQPHSAEMHTPEGKAILLRAYPVRDNRDRVVGVATFALNITSRKLAEERVLRKKEILEKLNSTLKQRVQEEVEKNREKDVILIQQNRQAALGEALEHIAHQWKQPINTIYLLVQDMVETYNCGELTDENVKQTVSTTMGLLEHMAQTIDVFRDFYKPEKEKITFLIKDSIESALVFIAPAFIFQGIAIELDVDPELSAIGYPKEYAQVLLNILGNARDAFKSKTPDNPQVTIHAFADDHKAVVTISDNAGGIPEAILDRIFDLYFTTKGSGEGTGIGLYMCKNIVEKNAGGTLSAVNIDRGAQFRIEINRGTSDAPPIE